MIYHSHSQETFADSREGKTEDTIVGVGDYLAQLLTENYGYQVMHVTESFDLAGGELDRSKAYDYARAWLEPVLEENPSIQILIDLHRDGVPEDRHLVTEINGKPTAQIMFYNGLSHTINSGDLSYLPNPYIQDNLAFSFQLEIRRLCTILNCTVAFIWQDYVIICICVHEPCFWRQGLRQILSRR